MVNTDKLELELITIQLAEMTAQFCLEKLNDEYARLCEKLVLKLSRKQDVPFTSGRIESWAAGIVTAIGKVNFLSNTLLKPSVKIKEIAEYFHVSPVTASAKAKEIQSLFPKNVFRKEFFCETAKNFYDLKVTLLKAMRQQKA
jgi:hypothetical protein